MPVGLSPNTGQPTKSESGAISASYSNLSRFLLAVKRRRGGQPISAGVQWGCPLSRARLAAGL